MASTSKVFSIDSSFTFFRDRNRDVSRYGFVKGIVSNSKAGSRSSHDY